MLLVSPFVASVFIVTPQSFHGLRPTNQCEGEKKNSYVTNYWNDFSDFVMNIYQV